MINEVIDDGVLMPLVLLHEGDPRFGKAAVAALGDADTALQALGDLAAAAGADPAPRRAGRRGPGVRHPRYPLPHLAASTHPGPGPSGSPGPLAAPAAPLMRDLGGLLLDEAPLAAWEGRLVPARRGEGRQWLTGADAEHASTSGWHAC